MVDSCQAEVWELDGCRLGGHPGQDAAAIALAWRGGSWRACR